MLLTFPRAPSIRLQRTTATSGIQPRRVPPDITERCSEPPLSIVSEKWPWRGEGVNGGHWRVSGGGGGSGKGRIAGWSGNMGAVGRGYIRGQVGSVSGQGVEGGGGGDYLCGG